MTTDRRDFLARVAAGAAATAASAGAFPAVLRASSAPESAEQSEFNSAFAAELRASLGSDSNAPMADPWDTSWTGKLTGKHRAVFDSPSIDGGVGVFRSGLWQRQYADVFKASQSDINSVIVLRHDAIVLTMAQPFWDEYDIGRKSKVTDPMTEKKTKKNPAMLGVADGVPASFASLALDKQMANGTIVLACNMAFAQMVDVVARQHKLKNDEARAKAIAGMIPGIILQPSGFFATTLAGQNGCVYVRAS